MILNTSCVLVGRVVAESLLERIEDISIGDVRV